MDRTDNGKRKYIGKKLTWQQELVLYLHDLVYMLAALMVMLALIFRIVVVSGSSMYDTLLDGDCLLVVGQHFCAPPRPGDIVVASKKSFDNGSPIIKRVIATEGQTVDIDFEAGTVYVDGRALDEPYAQTPTNTWGGVEFPLTVEDGCIFAMGDNRNKSRDSRYPEIGQIDTREIVGKAVLLLLPGTHFGEQHRDYGRMGAIN